MIRQTRLVVAALVAVALVAPGTAYATPRTWRNHDGTAETSVLVDGFYDWVSTGWTLPDGSVSSATSAAIRIYAQAEGCGTGTSGTQRIEWGATFAAEFDPCVVFPTSGFGWASIPIPLSLVHEGEPSGANYFRVEDAPGEHVARYGLDTDTVGFGMAYEDDGHVRRHVAGEPVWDLVLDGNTPALAASPGTVAFGLVDPGTTSAARRVTLTSTGTADIASVSSVTVSGPQAAEYAVTGDTCTGSALPFGATCTVDVTFTPTVIGTRSAMLTLAIAGGGGRTVDLTGEGRSLPPVSTITTADGAVLVPTDVVTGTVTDDLGMGTEYVTFRPALPSLATVTTRAALSCDAATTSCTWSASALLTPGPYTVTAAGTDRHGVVESPGPSISVVVL